MPISMKSFLVKSRNDKFAPSSEEVYFLTGKDMRIWTCDKIKDAVKARQAAEQEIYGKFLEAHKEAWNGDMKKG